MRLIDVSEVVFDYSGLAHINPYDFEGIAKYFAKQIAMIPPVQPEQAVKDCRNCKHGKYNDYHDTYFCYNAKDCSNWDKWETSAQPERPKGYMKIKVISAVDGEDLFCENCDAYCLSPSYNFCPKCGVEFIGVRGEQDAD